MGNRLGNKLNRLIKQRAYLSGEISVLESEADVIKAQADAKARELTDANAKLAEIDGLITELSSINPDDIKVIRQKRRRVKGVHGGLMLELIRMLKEADGPLDTRAMVSQIVKKFSFPMSNAAERRSARASVNGPLNKLKKFGVVVRHPSSPDSAAGRWEWVSDVDCHQDSNISSNPRLLPRQ